MSKMKSERDKLLARTIADNVIAIAKHDNISIRQLAIRSGNDAKTGWNLTNPEESPSNPQLFTINSISSYLNIDFWRLTVPQMPVSLMRDKELGNVIQMLAECSDENRQDIYEQIRKISKKDKMEKELRELRSRND